MSTTPLSACIKDKTPGPRFVCTVFIDFQWDEWVKGGTRMDECRVYRNGFVMTEHSS